MLICGDDNDTYAVIKPKVVNWEDLGKVIGEPGERYCYIFAELESIQSMCSPKLSLESKTHWFRN